MPAQTKNILENWNINRKANFGYKEEADIENCKFGKLIKDAEHRSTLKGSSIGK